MDRQQPVTDASSAGRVTGTPSTSPDLAVSSPVGRPVLVAMADAEAGPVVVRHFAAAGYKISTVNCGTEAIRELGEKRFDLLVLDTNFPGVDAIELVRRLRLPRSRVTDLMLNNGVPILVLGIDAESTPDTRTALLNSLATGADDAVPWPVSPTELLLKAGAVLRRARSTLLTNDLTFAIGPIYISSPAHEVRVDGEPVALTPTEFALLLKLAGSNGAAITRAQLCDALSSSLNGTSRQALDIHVGQLRRKLGVAAALVETVRGVGYRLCGA